MIKIIINNQRNFVYYNKFFVQNLLGLNYIKDNSSVISDVSVTNGTAKTTYANRFDDLNRKISELITKKSIKIHDVAASNGITSLELYHHLANAGFKPTLFFSDKFSTLYYYSERNKTFFYDTDGQYVFGYTYGMLASKLVSNFFLGCKWLYYISEKYAKSKFNHSLPTTLLLHADVIKTSEKNLNFRYISHDLFQDVQNGAYDLVRAMNILNPIYFSEKQLKYALTLIHQSLGEDGIFLVGRTHIDDGKNHASFYRKSNAGFVLIEHHNTGSEIRKLIENVNVLDG